MLSIDRLDLRILIVSSLAVFKHSVDLLFWVYADLFEDIDQAQRNDTEEIRIYALSGTSMSSSVHVKPCNIMQIAYLLLLIPLVFLDKSQYKAPAFLLKGTCETMCSLKFDIDIYMGRIYTGLHAV